MSLSLTNLSLFLLLFIAVFTDIKKRKIYNWLTFPGMLIGIIMNTLYYSSADKFTGLMFSLQGLLLGIIIFFVPFAIGGLGAGDLKLLGLIGAFLGWIKALWVGLYSAIAGGIFALGFLLLNLKQAQKVKTFLYDLAFSLIHNIKPPAPSEGASPQRRFPYSVAIAIGTLLVVLSKG